jgi:hypothetical protein
MNPESPFASSHDWFACIAVASRTPFATSGYTAGTEAAEPVTHRSVELNATRNASAYSYYHANRPDDIHCRPKASRRCEDVRRASLQTWPWFLHPSSLPPYLQPSHRRATGASSVVRSEWEDSSRAYQINHRGGPEVADVEVPGGKRSK